MDANNAHLDEEPPNPHVHHEPGDVNAHVLTKFGLGMGGLIVVFLFGLWGLFDYFVRYEAKLALPPFQGALVNTQKQPPEPRLQPYPVLDMREMRANEDRLLQTYAWVDPDKEIVKIPVDRAMDLIAERGLPAPAQGKTK